MIHGHWELIGEEQDLRRLRRLPRVPEEALRENGRPAWVDPEKWADWCKPGPISSGYIGEHIRIAVDPGVPFGAIVAGRILEDGRIMILRLAEEKRRRQREQARATLTKLRAAGVDIRPNTLILLLALTGDYEHLIAPGLAAALIEQYEEALRRLEHTEQSSDPLRHGRHTRDRRKAG